jgi:hypothetical protein
MKAQNFILKGFALAIFVIVIVHQKSTGQACESVIGIQLINIDGGYFSNQKVVLSSKEDGTSFNQKSDNKGNVIFKVNCSTLYLVSISNYAEKYEILSPENGKINQSLSYEANMIEKSKAFQMNANEIALVDEEALKLPDTLFVKGSFMTQPLHKNLYSKTSISIKNIDRNALQNETLVLSATKRKMNIKCKTDLNGNCLVYLLKGDTYMINFKYNKNFKSVESEYSKGSSNLELSFSYLGTLEIEKRKKEEAARIIAEEKRIKAEREKFAIECKKLGISIEEGYRREMRKKIYGTTDTVVCNVLNRNKWINKLIVCDLTGSMQPYAMQLLFWYQLNLKKEQNLQFVFFNDGSEMPDHKKVIGETGGIYYSSSKGIDSLTAFVAKVTSRGSGGDCPENNMEALIKGVKMAKPYNEIVLIADNHAPVKDISLLKNFNQPVHIIICGSSDDLVLEDYLLIAWKTKGSIHTMEQDIQKIAKMSEGQEIVIGKITYQIMGGEFVRITKI